MINLIDFGRYCQNPAQPGVPLMSEGVVTGLGVVFHCAAGALLGTLASFPVNTLACAVTSHGNVITVATSMAAMTWAIFASSKAFNASMRRCGLPLGGGAHPLKQLHPDVEYMLRPGLFILGAFLLTAPACKIGVRVLAGLLGMLSSWSKT